MDVQCERCKTEYEFDDALVSGRGTTVKCTNCGHQFKVRRQSDGGGVQDRWIVTTGSGREIVFTTLRELQRAIVAKQVARGDMLARGSGPPRPLGAIAELEPFFDERKARSQMPSVPPPGGGRASMPGAPPPPRRGPQRSQPDGQDTMPFGSSGHAGVGSSQPPTQPPPQQAPRRQTPRPNDYGPPSRMDSARGGTQLGLGGPPRPQPPATFEGFAGDAGMDDGQNRRRFRPPEPQQAQEEPEAEVLGKRRPTGIIVGLVLVAVVAVAGAVVVRPYLAGQQQTGTPATPPLDPRVQTFLNDGERALADGSLDTAKENFDKASLLSDHDPRVLTALSRLAAARGDVPWLLQRILAPEAVDELRAAKQSTDDYAARAKKTADEAVAIAPSDPQIVRAKIDALRLAGDGNAARILSPQVSPIAAQPETAYVLAALDLAEPDPGWPTVIDRLRLAAAGEGNSGRARAALVYAMTRSGNLAGAKSELDRLAALARAHPLIGPLRAFVDRASGTAKTTKDGGAVVAQTGGNGGNAGNPGPNPNGGGGNGGGVPVGGGNGGGTADPAAPTGDPRVMLQQAERALHAGDYERARTLYDGALSKNPSDSEALAGLGDVARAEHDLGTAMSFYRRALGVNPMFLPALIGLGDAQWDNGDKAGAGRTYHDVVDRFPEGTYPGRIKSRIDSAGGGGGGAAPEAVP